MNERIKELAHEAGLPTYNPEGIPTKLEKFAELIVRECLKVVIDGQYSDTECEGNSHRISYNNGRYCASSDIKKHFGVEE